LWTKNNDTRAPIRPVPREFPRVSGRTYNQGMASHPISWISQLALPRLTLLLNHIVSSEPVACARLQPHAGRTIDIHWVSSFAPPLPGFLKQILPGAQATASPWRFVITPAGLFEQVLVPAAEPSATDLTSAHAATAGLTITVTLADPVTMARQALKGERPEVKIEGDAALAEAASWLMKNLRWDVQDDVARWLGNGPAELLRSVGNSVRVALQRWRPGTGGNAGMPGQR